MRSRREFVQLLGLGAAATGLPSLIRVPSARAATIWEVPPRYARVPPGDERDPEALWEGDEVGALHPMVRDEGAPDELPAPSEEHDVIVVGGGISGLTAAFLLRDKDVLLLEAQSRTGGYAKSGTWEGVEYAQGAAYMLEPTAEDREVWALWQALELEKHGRRAEESANGLFLRGKLHRYVWDPASKERVTRGFREARGYFEYLWKEKFPELPFEPGGAYSADEFKAIDRASFPELVRRGRALWRDHGKARKLASLDPVLEEALELYARSSCGAPLAETSAWLFLNFFAAEQGGVRAFPGGNARVAQLLAARLKPGVVRANAPAVQVRQDGDKVVVTWRQGDEFRSARAKAAVLACPKFMAARLCAGLPEEQTLAMRRLKYSAYLVANVLVKKAVLPDFYDGYCLTGRVADIRRDDLSVPFTDLIVANWAANAPLDRTVITLYHALPFDGARFLLMQHESFFTLADEVRAGVRAVLAPLGLGDGDIGGVRLARWGHPLVRPSKGLFSSGVLELAARPWGRVRFAQQDTYGAAAIENAIISATRAAEQARALL